MSKVKFTFTSDISTVLTIYPKRLALHSGYTFMRSQESKTYDTGVAADMLYWLSYTNFDFEAKLLDSYCSRWMSVTVPMHLEPQSLCF